MQSGHRRTVIRRGWRPAALGPSDQRATPNPAARGSAHWLQRLRFDEEVRPPSIRLRIDAGTS